MLSKFIWLFLYLISVYFKSFLYVSIAKLYKRLILYISLLHCDVQQAIIFM